MSLDLDYSLLSTQKRVYEYTAALNQITFSGADAAGNVLAIDTNSTVKVYVNEVLQTSGVVSNSTNNNVTFASAPNTDSGTYTVTIIIVDAATDTTFLTTVTSESLDAETYIEVNDPGYDPLDTNTYYSDIKIESYLDDLEYATEDFAVSSSLSSLNFAIAEATDLFLEEKNNRIDADTTLQTNIDAIDATAGSAVQTSDFDSLFDTRLATKDTNDLDEGVTEYSDVVVTGTVQAPNTIAAQTYNQTVVTGTVQNPTNTTADPLIINGTSINFSTTNLPLADIINEITAAAIPNLLAASTITNEIELTYAPQNANDDLTIGANQTATDFGFTAGATAPTVANTTYTQVIINGTTVDIVDQEGGLTSDIDDAVASINGASIAGIVADKDGTDQLVITYSPPNGTALDLVIGAGTANTDLGLTASTTTSTTTDPNLYFTQARARNSISVSGDLSYDPATGVISTAGLAGSTTDDLAEGSTNLYYTDARARAALSGGTGVTYDSGTGVIAIGQDVGTTADVDFNSVTTAADIIVQGNLTVNGTTTTVNSNQVDIGDSIILLNSDETGAPSQNGGIEIERGTSDNVRFVWDEVDDVWTAQVYNAGTSTWDAATIKADQFDGTFTGNVTGQVSDISNFTTDDLAEGSTNLYYTDARADARVNLQTGANLDLTQVDTDTLPEGSTNLYFTQARARGSISVTDTGGGGSLTYDSATGVLTYTGPSDASVRTLISANTSTGAQYDSATGIISLANIPNSSLTNSSLTVNGTTISLGGSGSFTTNAVSEGTTNLYYTDARVTTRINNTSINALQDVDTASNTPSGGDALVWDANNGVWIPDAPFSQSDFDSAFNQKTTDDLTEGSTNLYYTTSRHNTDFDSRLAIKTTDDLAEGTSNLYYTEARVNSNFSAKTTDDLTEGSTNLYYTNARVSTHLASGNVSDIQMTGTLKGPAAFTLDPLGHGDNTGTVIIAGNLQVDGVTTTINSTTLSVDDLNLVLGDGSTNAASSNGGGITLDLGTDGLATILYDSANDRWVLNKDLEATLVGDVTGDVTGTVSDISNHDTDALAEGTSNLYYTDTRVGNYLANAGITAQPVWAEVTSSTVTATVGDRMIIDTSSQTVTVTMPSSPSLGDEVRIIDGSGNAATNNITITSSDNINGSSSDLIVDANGAGFGLVYYNSTRGWILIDK